MLLLIIKSIQVIFKTQFFLKYNPIKYFRRFYPNVDTSQNHNFIYVFDKDTICFADKPQNINSPGVSFFVDHLHYKPGAMRFSYQTVDSKVTVKWVEKFNIAWLCTLVSTKVSIFVMLRCNPFSTVSFIHIHSLPPPFPPSLPSSLPPSPSPSLFSFLFFLSFFDIIRN